MVCVYCGGETRVSNSRTQKKQNSIWRRRNCNDCGAVVTTLEKLDASKAVMVTHKTRQEAFSRDRLFVSLHDSLKHRKTALEDASALTDTIISHLYPLVHDAVLDRAVIIQESIKVLARFDAAASTQYAAYHRI